MLVLAFDTATDVATSALVRDGDVLGERVGSARELVGDVDELLGVANAAATELDALVVGCGPGSFTSTRMGLAFARGLGLALAIPGTGVSTLDALASVQPGAYPVIDARRGEVFVEGPRAVAPDDLELEPGTLCVGSGAVRYRETLQRLGAEVPPAGDERHLPHARLHASLAREYVTIEAIDPIYARVPDAELPRT
jgi:tRNA threonylcarbamoyl adenosine modification protein YeaZ